MGLSVEKIGFYCNSNTAKTNGLSGTAKALNLRQSNEINLNNNINNVSFKGIFFNKEPKKATLKPEPARLYGPYSLTEDVLNENDQIVYKLLEPIAESLALNNPENLGRFSYDTSRATNEAINAMVPVCISMLTCYPETQTIFPEFHDSIARSFPKACLRLDKERGTGNMGKVYFKVRNKIEGFGKAANPGTEKPLDDGIKYLYFADNIPLIRESKGEGIESTDEVIRLMKRGYIPKMSDVPGEPRCSMSRAVNEINKYGTPYIKEHFNSGKNKELGQETQYENVCLQTVNRNYHHEPEKAPKVESKVDSSYWPSDERFSFPGGWYLDPTDPRYDGNI